MDHIDEKEAIGTLELFYLAKDRRSLIQVANNEKLNPEIRQYASGLLMKPWLPWGRLRKTIMILLFLMGICGFLITGNFVSFILILFALAFSPRLVGEFLLLFSRKS
jgi:hypothetical protein